MTTSKAPTRILFIDDDEDLVVGLSVMLEREGFSIRHAIDGDIGVRMAREEVPDLILLDYMMPSMNGFEACTVIRQDERLANVPIVAMTSFGQNIGEIYCAGKEDSAPMVQACLEKPVEPNVLLECIMSAMKQQTADAVQ